MANCLIWGTVGFFWLLALRPSDWINVFLVGSIPSFWATPIQSIWAERLHCSPGWPPLTLLNDLHIGFVGESSLPALGDALQASPFNGPTIGFYQQSPTKTERHRRRILSRFPSPMSTLRVSHATVSGVTDFTGLFLLRHLAPPILPSGVPTSLSAIVDHKRYLPPWDPSSTVPHVSEDALLPVTAPLSPIRIRSRFSPSGFGIRTLSPRELLSAWDVPLWAPLPPTRRSAASLLQSLPPLGILLRLADSALCLLDLPSSPLQGHALSPLPPALDPSDIYRSWIPSLQRWLPHEWIDASLLTPKAAKADNAALPTHLWDKRISLVSLSLLSGLLTAHSRGSLEFLRSFPVPYGGVLSFGSFGPMDSASLSGRASLTAQTHPFVRDVVIGRQVLWKFTQGSWWKWDQGSTPIFWRWPTPESREAARDGFCFYVKTDLLPSFHTKGKPLKTDVALCLADKVGDLLGKAYISPLCGSSSSLSQIDYFAVPKVVSPEGEVLDVRLVFNGTSCGLNDALWAPSFWLPTPDTALRKLHFASQMVDFDLGEFFLNFFLPYSVRPFAGVNLQPLAKHLLGSLAPVRDVNYTWNRLLFGLKPSPYNSIRFYYHAEEYVVGDPRETGNPLRWDRVVLNLPGDTSFDPRLPWVYLWDDERKTIAGSVVTFVDDGRGC